MYSIPCRHGSSASFCSLSDTGSEPIRGRRGPSFLAGAARNGFHSSPPRVIGLRLLPRQYRFRTDNGSSGPSFSSPVRPGIAFLAAPRIPRVGGVPAGVAPPSWAGSRLGLRLAEGRPPGGLCRRRPGGGLLFNDYAYSANEYAPPCASGVVVTRPRPGAPRRLPGCPRPVSARAPCPAALPWGASLTRELNDSIISIHYPRGVGRGGGCHCASSSRGFVGVPALWPA